MPTFTAPTLSYGLLLPFVVILVAACLGVLLEAAVPRGWRLGAQVGLTAVAIVVSVVVTIGNWLVAKPVIDGVKAVAIDGPKYFMWLTLLVLGALAIFTFADRRLEAGRAVFTAQAATVPGSVSETEANAARVEHTEVFPLALFALSGMMLFPASNDLITMFIALEILSLPLYLLCGLARRRRLLSQEASMKYFLLGALSSAFFLYGVAMLYGFSGSFRLGDIAAAVSGSNQGDGLLLAGMALVAVGLFFKVSAVPFHAWTPDVYTGAPTVVTGFMASCTKLAAIGALMRVFYLAFGGVRWDWQPLMAVVAIASIAVGSLLAITQTDIKRMLAYSSIAHAGFLLTAVSGAYQLETGAKAGQITSMSSVLFYLATYGLSTIGAFAVVTMVRHNGGEVTTLSGWAGLAKKSPLLAAVFSLFLFSFAGIPLTAGFIGKWAVFAAAWAGGAHWLVVVAVVLSVVAAFFYVRVIVAMYLGTPAIGPMVVRAGLPTMAAVVIGAVATLVLGIYPGPLLALAEHAGEFVR
ncbi:MAG: NADH-quinone oxidoreductase subunit NuoN [Propionibacteriaceae bacterium]